jgi:flagellar motor switch protein FliM
MENSKPLNEIKCKHGHSVFGSINEPGCDECIDEGIKSAKFSEKEVLELLKLGEKNKLDEPIPQPKKACNECGTLYELHTECPNTPLHEAYGVSSVDPLNEGPSFSDIAEAIGGAGKPIINRQPGEILSQDQIDSLLASISSGEVEDPYFERDNRKARIYDFTRPDTLTKDNILCIQRVFERFSFLSKITLHNHLNTPNVMSYVCSVDQLTFEEYIRSIPSNELVFVINPDPYSSVMLFSMPVQLVNVIIERLCGGSTVNKANDDNITDFELSLMEGVCIRFLGNLREAFWSIADLRPRLSSIETNTRYVNMITEKDMGVLTSLELRVDDLDTMINFWIPQQMLSELVKQKVLTVKKFMSYEVYEGEDKVDLGDIEKTLYHIVEPFNMLLEEVKKIEVGTILPLENKTQIVWREL